MHRGRVFSVEVLELRDRDGRIIERDIVRHPGAVLVVPLLPGDRLVMIRNFRVAVQKELWEFPAGKLESGEPPIQAAGRELEEETGYLATRIERLGDFYTSPGFADELMHVFLADGLKKVGQRLKRMSRSRSKLFRESRSEWSGRPAAR